MNRNLRFLLTFTCCFLMASVLTPAAEWRPITWLNEKALVSVTRGWKAVVSLERGRLMYFGPADTEFNLLLAPPTRDNPNIWGGHRVWMGPQASWSKGWPPPREWESSGPASQTSKDGVLELVMNATKDDWPRITRTYQWDGVKLNCGVTARGGNRPAQIVQIFQVPASTVVTARAHPVDKFVAGYVRLPSMVSHFAAEFPQPAHVTRTGDELTLRHIGAIEKLGFSPQTLTGRSGNYVLTVARGTQSGTVMSEPDQGFFTQVYLGGQEPFIELEQLSPLFAAGQPASFTVVLEAKLR